MTTTTPGHGDQVTPCGLDFMWQRISFGWSPSAGHGMFVRCGKWVDVGVNWNADPESPNEGVGPQQSSAHQHRCVDYIWQKTGLSCQKKKVLDAWVQLMVVLEANPHMRIRG